MSDALEARAVSSVSYWGGGWSRPGLVGDVWAERIRQLEKWGLQERPSGVSHAHWHGAEMGAKLEHDRKVKIPGALTWADILKEEVYEAFAEEDPAKLRVELVQCMAVLASWIQDLDRRGGEALGHGKPPAEEPLMLKPVQSRPLSQKQGEQLRGYLLDEARYRQGG